MVGWLGTMDQDTKVSVMTVQWTFVSSIEHPFKPSTPVASLKGPLQLQAAAALQVDLLCTKVGSQEVKHYVANSFAREGRP